MARHRPADGFLHAFRRALQLPVDNPNRVHIDYIPSQLVIEWIRHFMRVDGKAIDGLAWESVRRPRSRCVVLWVTRDRCLEVGKMDPWRDHLLAVELRAVRRLH